MDMDLPYKVEYAKTGRAGCKKCKSNIAQGILRMAAMVQVRKLRKILLALVLSYVKTAFVSFLSRIITTEKIHIGFISIASSKNIDQNQSTKSITSKV